MSREVLQRKGGPGLSSSTPVGFFRVAANSYSSFINPTLLQKTTEGTPPLNLGIVSAHALWNGLLTMPRSSISCGTNHHPIPMRLNSAFIRGKFQMAMSPGRG
jgi:hypothetical protein